MEQQSEEKAAEVQFEEKALEVSNSTETEKSVPDSELRIFLRKVRLSLEDTRVKVLFIIYNFINTCVILNAGFVKECSSIQEVAFVLNNCSIILVVSCLLMFGWTTDPKRKEFARDMCLIIDFNSCMLNVILWVPLILCLLHGKCDVCITQAEITTVLMLVYNTWNFLKMQGARVLKLLHVPQANPLYKFTMSKNDLRILDCYNYYARRVSMKIVATYYCCWCCADYCLGEAKSFPELEVDYKVDRTVHIASLEEIWNINGN